MGKFNLEKAQYDNGYSQSNPVYDGSQMYLYTDKIKTHNLSKRTILIVAGVVVIVVVAMAVGLGVGLKKKSDSESGSKSKQQGTGPPSTSTAGPLISTLGPSTQRPGSTTHRQGSTTHRPGSTTRGPKWIDQPCISQRPVTCPWSNKPLLLVSLDGFRAEYVLRNYTPVIQKLRSCGVHTPYMRAVYPTLTFPNHYTIITGMYPASTGIVGNSMYDPHINASYSIGGDEKSNPAWYSGEPLWTTAKKQGKRTASYFWVGSEYNISGVQPDIWFPYDGKVTFEERVDTALAWLREEDRPDFITLYFDQPDHEAHGEGPDSPQVNAELKKVDATIGRLMDGLLHQGMDHCVNVIVLADHGMSPTSCERQVDLDKYMSKTELDKMLIYSGTTGHINPLYRKWKKNRNSKTAVLRNSQVESATSIRDSLQCKSSHLKVYTEDTIPVRHHYTNSARIGPVVMDVEESWLVYPKPSKRCLKGNHGYDNIYKSMHALFLAHGPSFKESVEVKPFENIELYNLMSDLLKIEPSANNGTRGSLNHILRQAPQQDNQKVTTYRTCGNVNNRTESSTCSCNFKTDYIPVKEAPSKHVPWGIPSNEAKLDLCQLYGNQFVSAYSDVYKMPAWTSYTLTPNQMSGNGSEGHCVVTDPRLDDEGNPDCTEYQHTDTSVQFYSLYDPVFSNSEANRLEAMLSSNIVPMFTGFRQGIWQFVTRLVGEYVTKYGALSVIMGPAFDDNFDSLADTNGINNTVYSNSSVAMPTHYYLILARCSEKAIPMAQCGVDSIVTMAFILPHKNETNNCQTYKDFLQTNVARIRDIELLTGLRFLTAMSRSDGARIRTFLAIDLWPAPAVASWKDLPCISNITETCPYKSPPLLLISLDGFRAEYLTRNLTPTIKRLAQCGVHTPYMRATYPTVTFPNHYTIVTGLYPESHGIIANHIYDKDIGEKFSLGKPISLDPRWWKGEPLWITSKNQGLKSATYFWPGSDVNISGMHPNIYKAYDGKAGFPARVDKVLSWLMLPEDRRPAFLTLYFDQPDHAGHMSGPRSQEVDGMLQTVDDLIDMLMTKLYEKNLHHCINIITVADHGFASQSCSQALIANRYSPEVSDMLMFGGVMGNVLPQFVDNGKTVMPRTESIDVDDVIRNLTCRHPSMKAFSKATLPRRHHYTNSDRIGDILLDMKEEWLVSRNKPPRFCTGGNHGWDNIYKNMHALFLAHGPSFKENYKVEPFENIELYNLMCDALNITAASNNGTVGSLDDILKSPPARTSSGLSSQATCNYKHGLQNLTTCNCSKTDTLTPSEVFSNMDQIPGLPDARSTNNDTDCILYQSGFSITYSQSLKLPVAIKTTVTKTQSANYWLSNNSCILHDIRTGAGCPPSINVPDIELTPLISTGISDQDEQMSLSSTVVPMYSGFKNGVWNTLLQLLDDYSSLYGNLSVTMGTILDYNNDGLWEGTINETKFADSAKTMPIPTHIYMIIVKCKNKTKPWPCHYDLDILSFILPHLQKNPNCLSVDLYLKDNVARIRDIELLTGLQFVATMSGTNTVKLRTFLPENIWSSRMFTSWIDEPCPQSDLCESDYKPLLLISLDGFRADYLIRNFTPTIARLSQCGTHAPFMRSVYPTKTFPNHYSIVTGLYPESHGIIDNDMYDMEMKLRFSLSGKAKFNPSWWGGEPIWSTAQRQGLKTATYFWPGSDVKIGGRRPDIWKEYDGKATYSGRVYEVLSWLMLPKDKRPDFVTLYFEEPDHAGHADGPSKIQAIGDALAKVDSAINELMSGLMRYGLQHCVNLVIVADHGMADVDCDRVVRLGNLVDYSYLSSNFWVWDGPVGRISNAYKYKRGAPGGIALNNNPEPIDRLVTNLTCANPHLNTYTKATLPVRHHYTNNPRIDNIILDMESGWLVTRNYIRNCYGGNHGYDNIDKSMEALFLGYGPVFKWNYTAEPFENIELYNMFAEILNINAAPNNGTWGSLHHLLHRPPWPVVPTMSPYLRYVDALAAYRALGNYADYTIDKCLENCTSIEELYSNASQLRGTWQTLPFGHPEMTSETYAGRNITVLYYDGYAAGYDADRKHALWISQTMNGSQTTNGSHVNGPFETYEVDGPASVIIEYSKAIAELLTSYRQVNVLSGYGYDSNHDSLPDPYKSPKDKATHFWAVLTTCKDTEDLLVTAQGRYCTDFKTQTYIIPLTDGNKNCKPAEEYLIDVEARVRDVEILSGLQLFSNVQFDQAVKIRTFLPQRPSMKGTGAR